MKIIFYTFTIIMCATSVFEILVNKNWISACGWLTASICLSFLTEELNREEDELEDEIFELYR